MPLHLSSTRITSLSLYQLAANNFGRLDSLGCIARIHHKLRFAYDVFVVVVGVVRHDEDAVVLSEVFEWGTGHVQIVMAAPAYRRKVRVVVENLGALCTQQLDDRQRGRF